MEARQLMVRQGEEVGLLEILSYLAAIVMVVGLVMEGGSFNWFIVMVMLDVLYAILRDVKALTGVTSQIMIIGNRPIVHPLYTNNTERVDHESSGPVQA